MPKPEDTDVNLLAAQKIVLARLGPEYGIIGCDPPSESDDWIFWVSKRASVPGRPLFQRPLSVTVTQEQIDEVIEKDLDIAQIQGKKPKPEQVREEIQREYNEGMDALFEGRD